MVTRRMRIRVMTQMEVSKPSIDFRKVLQTGVLGIAPETVRGV